MRAEVQPWRAGGLSLGGTAVGALALAVGGGWFRLHFDAPLLAGGHYVISALLALLGTLSLLRGRLREDWDPLEPTRLWCAVWFATLALCFLRLSSFEQPLTLRTWLVVGGGLAMFYSGTRVAYALWPRRTWLRLRDVRLAVRPPWHPEIGFWLLLTLTLLGLGAFAYTAYHFGGFPILSGDVEWARNNFSINSYLQRVILTLSVLAPIAASYFMRFRRRGLIVGAVWLSAAMIFFLMASSYFVLVVVIVSFVLYRYTAPRLDWRRIATILLLLFVAKMAIDTFRNIRTGYFANLTAYQNFPRYLLPFAGDYFYIVMNLQVLQHLAAETPAIFPYRYGYYLSYPARAAFERATPGKGKGKLSDQLWDASAGWFGFSSVTASCFGEGLEDFGLPGVLAWSFLFGFCAAAAYARLRQRPSWLTSFVVAQFTLAILLSFFSNIFALFDVYWAMAVAFGFDRACRSLPARVAWRAPAVPVPDGRLDYGVSG